VPYHKIAKNLLETHCTVDSFDVDFFDVQVSEVVAAELEKLGAKVLRSEHSSSLHVICPERDASDPDDS